MMLRIDGFGRKKDTGSAGRILVIASHGWSQRTICKVPVPIIAWHRVEDYNIAAAIMTTTPAPPAYMPFKFDAAPMKLSEMDEVATGAPVPETRGEPVPVVGIL